jgi:hypothetical protein
MHYILFGLLVAVIFVSVLLEVSLREPFISMLPEVILIDKDYLKTHVLTSSFFRGLTLMDLLARNQSTGKPADYAYEYIEAYVPFTVSDKGKINKAMNAIQNLLRDFPKLLATRWNFVKVRDGIENNYPHTIGNVIVLNDTVMQTDLDDFVKTIIHERFHVLQRMIPLPFHDLYKRMGFSPIRLPNRPIWMRSNPDLDSSLYIHEGTRTIPIQLYDNSSPHSIAQSSTALLNDDGSFNSTDKPTNQMFGLPMTFHCQLEHPAEISACLLAEIITSYSNDDFVQNKVTNEIMKKAYRWLQTYFSS